MSHVQKPLAEDLLSGLAAIASYVYGDDSPQMRRRVQFEHGRRYLPTFKHGGRVCARKSELDRHFSSDRGQAA